VADERGAAVRQGSDRPNRGLAAADARLRAWEKQVLSARGFKRVGRRSEYAR
jgi:hypothetical protein